MSQRVKGALHGVFPTADGRIVRDTLLVMTTVFLVAFPAIRRVDANTGKGLATAGRVAACAISAIVLYWCYLRKSLRWARPMSFVERHAVRLLAAWMVILLTWCALVLFSNPYRYEVNGGDAAFFSQALWNIVHGFKPETSWLTLNGVITPGDDPRYANAYGFVSIFSLHQGWLPIALLAPIYSLYSQPPMHMFALQICVVVLGLPGVYWATRCVGGSKPFALGAAIAYSSLPQIGTQLFFLGYMDVVGLATLPWLFGALFCRRWGLVALVALLTALVSFPFTYFVVFFGLTMLLFFRAPLPGAVVIVIGWVVMKVDTAIMTTALAAYPTAGPSHPSFLTTYVLDRTIGSLIDVVRFNVLYLMFLAQTMAFLPFLALWRRGRLNIPLLGLFFLLGLAFVPMMFRSYGWEFQRNSFFIVPVFMLGLFACASLNDELAADNPEQALGRPRVPTAVLFMGMLPAVLLGNPFTTGPLRSHYPWGSDISVTPDAETRAWDRTLRQFRAIVPDSVSLAWEADPEVMAVLTNRRQSWSVGREPRGVKYYAFLGSAARADGPAEAAKWNMKLAQLRADTTFEVVYDGNPGKPLLVLKNLNNHPIPRDENLLGWSVVTRPFRTLWR